MRERAAPLVAAAAALLIVALVSPRFIPFNMDEFVHYHALGCATAPLQRGLPAFRDGCGLYDLRLPLTTLVLPLRSYFYIGSFPALPFAPFWWLLDEPVAARVQGAVFFGVFVLLAARLLRVRRSSLLVAALVPPVFLTTFLVDEGPVGLAAILLVGALLAGRRAFEAPRRPAALGWAAFAGALLFLGLWSKLVFLAWLPAVAVFLSAEATGGDGRPALAALRRRAPALLAGALALALPTLLLLASVDVEGRPYGAAVRRGRLSLDAGEVAARFARLARQAGDPDQLAPRNVEIASSPLDALPAGLAVALVLGGALRRSTPASGPSHRTRLALVGWACLGVLTLGLLALSAYSQWPHHAFYGLLLIVLALGLGQDALPRPLRLAVTAVVALSWATLLPRVAVAGVPTEASADKDALLRFVRASGLDRKTLQVHTTWGTYYTAQLFGDRERMVVFLKALSDDPVQLREVRDIALERGRPVLYVSARQWERLQTPAVAETLGEPERRWRFGEWWLVEYRPATTSSPRP